MIQARNWLRWQRDYEWPKRLERGQSFIVGWLPRWVIRAAFVRVFAEATTGPLSGVDCASVPATEVFKAWATRDPRP
jgi:hypothetical protein